MRKPCRFVSKGLWALVLGCSDAEVPAEPEPPAPAEPVWAQIPVLALASASGDLLLWWRGAPALAPIPLRQRPGEPHPRYPQAWTSRMPLQGGVVPIDGWIDPADLEETRRRTGSYGVPAGIGAAVAEIDAHAWPTLGTGPVQLIVTDTAERQGTSLRPGFLLRRRGDHVWLSFPDPAEAEAFRQTAEHATILVMWDGFSTAQPERLALDSPIPEGLAVGQLVRFRWPEAQPPDADLDDGAFLYLGPDANGWPQISGRPLRALAERRVLAGPPTLEADSRTPLRIPLRTTPDPSRMAVRSSVTDGRYRSPAFPYLGFDDHEITLLVEPTDAEWLRYWIQRAGGSLAISRGAGLEFVAPAPPDFPPGARLFRRIQ